MAGLGNIVKIEYGCRDVGKLEIDLGKARSLNLINQLLYVGRVGK